MSSETAQTSFTLTLLGRFTLTHHSQPLQLSRKTRALLAWLTLAEQPTTRQQLIDLFCEAANDPARTLRWHLSALRRTLSATVLHTEGQAVALNRSLFAADCWQFDTAAPSTDLLTLYRGEFLEGLSLPDAPAFELWLLGVRSHYRGRLQEIAHIVIDRLINQREFATAIQISQQLLHIDPLQESFHGRLIWLYAHTGQRESALTQFEHYQELLRKELDAAVSPDLQTLYEAVKSGTLTSQSTFTPPKPPPTSQPTNTLIGRAATLRTLSTHWQQCHPGAPTLVLIAAEAGLGKTTLVDIFLNTQDTITIQRATCYESTRDLPFQPWLQMIGRAWHTLTAATQRLDQLLLTVADHLLTAGDLIIFVDDLHQADENSLRLFHYLLQRAYALPVRLLLIGTYRPEEVADNPALARLLPDLARMPHSTTLHLSGFTAAQITTLLTQSGLPADAQLSQQLLTATDGNPLFITEILRERPSISSDQTLPLSPSLHTVVQRRLDRLPEAQRLVLEMLAVFDSPSSLRNLQLMSKQQASAVAAVIETGERYGLIQRHDEQWPTTVDIRHDLLREAILQTISPLSRRAHHGRIAHTLAQRTGNAPGRILQHACEGEEVELILDFAQPAAQQAETQHALPKAIAALESYQQAYEMLPETAAQAQATQRISVLLDYGRLLHRTSLLQTTHQTLLNQLDSLLSRHPNPEQQAQFLIIKAQWHNAQRDIEAALSAIEQARDLYLEVGDEKGAAHTFNTRSDIETAFGRNRAGLQSAETAVARFSQLNDPLGLSRSQQALATAQMNLGRITDMITLLTDNLADAQAHNDLLSIGEAHTMLAIAKLYFYAGEEARQHAAQAQHIHQETGRISLYAVSTLMLAHSYEVLEDFRQARILAQEALDISQKTEHLWCQMWSQRALMRYHYFDGNLDQAEAISHQYLPVSQQSLVQNYILDLIWQSRLCLGQDRAAEALKISTQAITLLENKTDDYYVYGQAQIIFMYGEALLANDQPAAARHAIEQAYTELHQFATQIKEPDIRTQFFNALPHRQLLHAYRQLNSQVKSKK